MWILTTRARPQLAAECLAGCMENGMTSRGVFYIDGDEEGLYDEIELPDNWTKYVAVHQGLSAALEWCLWAYPHEPNYGWLADDMCPMTPGWDVILEQNAGNRCMSQALDNWVSLRFPKAVRTGHEPSAGQCWGGDLVRANGWWALPRTRQAGTDVAWSRIVTELGRMRFSEGVVVEHRQWRTGKRKQDALDTDMLDSNGHAHTKADLEVLRVFLEWNGLPRAVRRISKLCP